LLPDKKEQPCDSWKKDEEKSQEPIEEDNDGALASWPAPSWRLGSAFRLQSLGWAARQNGEFPMPSISSVRLAAPTRIVDVARHVISLLSSRNEAIDQSNVAKRCEFLPARGYAGKQAPMHPSGEDLAARAMPSW
jgi:hypothetical protein